MVEDSRYNTIPKAQNFRPFLRVSENVSANSGTKQMANRHIASPRVVNIQDLRGVAQRVLPKVVFDYIDGGAEGEVTMRENRRAFDEVTFRPRGAVAVPPPDIRTTVLGAEIAMPLMLGPCGFI